MIAAFQGGRKRGHKKAIAYEIPFGRGCVAIVYWACRAILSGVVGPGGREVRELSQFGWMLHGKIAYGFESPDFWYWVEALSAQRLLAVVQSKTRIDF